jgi:ABC-type glycerol-3-phosphate transport system permease component
VKQARNILLIVAAAIAVYPLFWMTMTSLKSNAAIAENVWSLPTQPTLEAYTKVLTKGGAARSLRNSVIIAGTAVAGVTILAALAGYGFGRFEFRGKRLLWYIFIAGLFLPVHVTLIPLHRMEAMMGLSRGPGSAVFLCIVYMAFNMSFSVFFLRSFFADIPQELVDAAAVDGCGHGAVFWRILLPVSMPALTVVALINAVMIWNEFVFALVLLQSEAYYTLPLMAMHFADETGLDLSRTTAVLTLATLPIIVLFAVFQKRLITGISQGALK